MRLPLLAFAQVFDVLWRGGNSTRRSLSLSCAYPFFQFCVTGVTGRPVVLLLRAVTHSMNDRQKCRAPDAADRPRIMAHYHLYKAAGTTVTLAMRRHFGGLFSELDKCAEFRDAAAYNIEFFERTVQAHPRLVAMSAHRVVPNIHLAKSLEVFPIAFIRHPLLRAASVWRYDRKRKTDGPGKAEALTREFPAWIDWCLQPNQLLECRNIQSRMLSLPDDGAILCCKEGEVIRGDFLRGDRPLGCDARGRCR